MSTTTSVSAAQFLDSYRTTLAEAFGAIDPALVQKAADWLTEARDNGNTIFICGNGGSAASASHIVCDIVKGASFQREKRFRMLCLNDNMATVTAYANDVGYDVVFAEPLKNFAKPGDIFWAISGSGNSPNVVKAMELANELGLKTLAFTGRDGGKLGKLAQLEIRAATPHMGRIEDVHMGLCHVLAYYFMEASA